MLSAAISGISAEVLKLVVARERPAVLGDIQPGWYHFRGIFCGFIDGAKNLGFPSSHAAVAFGGCLMFAYFVRDVRWWMVLLAIGCGVTRMLTGAHFASDIYGAAIIGWFVSSMLIRFVPQDSSESSGVVLHNEIG